MAWGWSAYVPPEMGSGGGERSEGGALQGGAVDVGADQQPGPGGSEGVVMSTYGSPRRWDTASVECANFGATEYVVIAGRSAPARTRFGSR